MIAPELIFEWRVDPLAANPRRATAACVVLIALSAGVGLSFHSVWWALFTFAVLAGSLHRLWLPTVYRIHEDRLERQLGWFKTARPWPDFKRAVFLQNAVFLSPFAEPSRLDGHRGWLVQLPEDKSEIVQWIRRQLPAAPR